MIPHYGEAGKGLRLKREWLLPLSQWLTQELAHENGPKWLDCLY